MGVAVAMAASCAAVPRVAPLQPRNQTGFRSLLEETWVPEHLLSQPIDRLVKSPSLGGVGASRIAAARAQGAKAVVELIMDTEAKKTSQDPYYNKEKKRWKWKEDMWWLPADTPASFNKDAGMQAPILSRDRHWQDSPPYELPPTAVLQPQSADPALEWGRRVAEATKTVKPIPWKSATHCGPVLIQGKKHGWPVCPHVIPTKKPCVAYLVGIGAFPHFDAELAHSFGCEVHSFDPSPTGKGAMDRLKKSGKMPPNHFYHDYGVAHQDGEVVTYAPKVGDQYTRDCTAARNGNCRKVTFQVKTIKTIMRELGHTHLNVLKIDTEGGEFEDVMGMHLDGVLGSVDSYCSELHYFSTTDGAQTVWDGKKGAFSPAVGWPKQTHIPHPQTDGSAWNVDNAKVLLPEKLSSFWPCLLARNGSLPRKAQYCIMELMQIS